jgi:uncharacterized membrane protein
MSDRWEDPLVAPKDVQPRLESVDLLRGVVMVVMVLDHVRDFFMNPAIDPTNLTVASPALFFTRWITHFCAPTFVFLAGVGAGLSSARGKPRRELSIFLLTRGAWLIVLEWLVMSFGVCFAIVPGIFALILWAIGWSMIVLAALIHLPRAAIGAIGVGMIALHNLLDGVQVEGTGAAAILWRVLHVTGFQPLPGSLILLVGYPLIPWIGVMASGYAFAPMLLDSPVKRRRVLLGLGLAMIAGFVALRATNAYGDSRPWTPQQSPIYTIMSFLNCQKYPPSLLFLLMTLGPAFLALTWFDRGFGRWPGRVLLTFGRVPLFYFILQWPIAHGLAVAFELLQGHPVGWMFAFPPFQAPPEYGYSLATTYLMWIVVVALLYYPSRWFADLKRRRHDAWLSYL